MIELRFFAGLTTDETAEAMGVSAATVTRGWRLARAWLHHRLTKGSPPSPHDAEESGQRMTPDRWERLAEIFPR